MSTRRIYECKDCGILHAFENYSSSHECGSCGGSLNKLGREKF